MTPWIFEPHSLFGTDVADEEWPFGYLSEGVGQPIFQLYEIGVHSDAKLAAVARLAVAAPTLSTALSSLVEMVETAIQAGDWRVDGACDPERAIDMAKSALAQAIEARSGETGTGSTRKGESAVA